MVIFWCKHASYGTQCILRSYFGKKYEVSACKPSSQRLYSGNVHRESGNMIMMLLKVDWMDGMDIAG